MFKAFRFYKFIKVVVNVHHFIIQVFRFYFTDVLRSSWRMGDKDGAQRSPVFLHRQRHGYFNCGELE